ncbi:MAG: RNA polymerase sigma factor [Thalassolituus sp.]|uniref:RNA polymerase sigma factor n=1 Tax=Thalassolituus TaxID=187492 RepID=UPI00042DBB1A|nr:RNA polymerase sigma factor [Thalassolituus oleivorans]AHK16130.1 RNA polymerase subunit sigma-70 [Thalassolituus oleivorans R6-15]
MDNEMLMNLIARCALREQKALEALYQAAAAYLNGVAFRILGSADSSNDVLQESFVQIWNNAASYTPAQGNPTTWMTSIVRYRAIDKLRHEARHQNRPHHEAETEILLNTPTEETQEEIYSRFRLNAQLKKCLESMNDKFKQSLELAYLYGYSREELADVLDTNINTVKTWLKRGGAKLKVCMEGENGGSNND